MQPLTLTPDEIDDVLYFTRVNETQELQQTLAESAAKYQCTIKAIIEGCVDPHTGNTVLHYASANGLLELLPFLLSNLTADGALSPCINFGNSQGNTPLHWAAYNGHLAIVKLLVAAGADMWQKNSAGHLAMFEAERADKGEVVQYLLEIGGERVEQGGSEGQASVEDVADAQNGDVGSSSQIARPTDIDIAMTEDSNT